MRISYKTLLLVFIGLSFIYYFFPLRAEIDEKIFITVATFVFAIFAGFFISRQSQRYSSIRDQLAAFDGNMSFMYRTLGHFGPVVQQHVKKIAQAHYHHIFKERSWSYPLTHKTTTIGDLHQVIDEAGSEKNLSALQNAVLARTLASLQSLQISRKNMVALYEERVPASQWVLLYFLGAILLASLSLIASQGLLFPAILKASFGTAIILVLILLNKLDRLDFFEGTIGEHSARDVLNILEGTI